MSRDGWSWWYTPIGAVYERSTLRPLGTTVGASDGARRYVEMAGHSRAQGPVLQGRQRQGSLLLCGLGYISAYHLHFYACPR